MFRWHVVSAVFGRNVKQYFSGPLGYLFIVVFVTVSAVMAFSPQFFAENQATLDQLSRWFPMLLLFFIPAVTMSVWAEEKRQGTDSILFTLPASDFDIVLGKYLAVAAVYTVALLFSLTQVLVLEYLGDPDLGVLATTYLGYWLAGLALLAVGMFASSLTNSATVAFVLGALFCAVPVLIGYYFRGFVGIERFGFDWNLRDFTLGLIPLGNVIYFVGLTVFMLYLNLIVISKRHWNQSESVSIGGQYFARAISLAVILTSLGFLSSTLVSSLWARADLTQERLYTLDQATVDTLEKVKQNDREVTIQAFVSTEVPRKYVNSKKQFVGLLRQFSEYGGKNVTVRYVDVEPNSPEALDAEQSGVEPQDDRSEVGGRFVEQKVFLGATVSTSLDNVALPFVGDDTAIEYELSRSIASTIDKKNQISIGIVDSDFHFGGFEVDGRRVDFIFNAALDELKKQFEIEHINQDELIGYVASETAQPSGDQDVELKKGKKTAPDVLLVADPSSLDDIAMDSLVKYVEAGNPTILLADPPPFVWAYRHPTAIGILNAPKQPRISQQSPYSQILSSSVMPKSDDGSASKILKAIGVDCNNGSTVWTNDDPHSSFKGEWPEYLGPSWPEYYGLYNQAFVFVRDHADVTAFNGESLISKGLKELLLFYPGTIRKSADSPFDFQPLVSLGTQSGPTTWDRLTKTPKRQTRTLDPRTGRMSVESRAARNQITGDDLIVLDPDVQKYLDEDDHVVAARVTGQGDKKLDVVVIADLDFLSEVYLDQEEALGEKLDNLSLLQNAIEILAGQEGFVALRNRRATPRTLEQLEKVIDKQRSESTKQQADLEKKVQDQMKLEQEKLDEANKEIQSDQSIGFFEKLQRTSQQASEAQRRFDLKKKKLDRELKDTIATLDSETQQVTSGLENRTRYLSILLAPLPALLLGVVVLWYRKINEEKDIASDRRVGG